MALRITRGYALLGLALAGSWSGSASGWPRRRSLRFRSPLPYWRAAMPTRGRQFSPRATALPATLPQGRLTGSSWEAVFPSPHLLGHSVRQIFRATPWMDRTMAPNRPRQCLNQRRVPGGSPLLSSAALSKLRANEDRRRQRLDGVPAYAPRLSAAGPRPHELNPLFRIRRFVGMWKLLFLEARVSEPSSAAKSRCTWSLSGGNACSLPPECHSSRNVLGAIKPASRFAGGPNPEGLGFAPNKLPSAPAMVA